MHAGKPILPVQQISAWFYSKRALDNETMIGELPPGWVPRLAVSAVLRAIVGSVFQKLGYCSPTEEHQGC